MRINSNLRRIVFSDGTRGVVRIFLEIYCAAMRYSPVYYSSQGPSMRNFFRVPFILMAGSIPLSSVSLQQCVNNFLTRCAAHEMREYFCMLSYYSQCGLISVDCVSQIRTVHLEPLCFSFAWLRKKRDRVLRAMIV